MSGMHMLPVYYTTTNHKKRRKKKMTKRMEAALVEHEKFLKRMGVDPNYKRTPTPLKTERSSVKLPEKKISFTLFLKLKSEIILCGIDGSK